MVRRNTLLSLTFREIKFPDIRKVDLEGVVNIARGPLSRFLGVKDKVSY